ncbi:hypothetical protein [Algoriphagus aquimarinus]|uniref:hypothetical protein n=1 Tax=Algoriphagus aquimarinus TaxID=237018 RepID=UPI0030D9AC82
MELKGYFGVSGAMANWNEDLDGASSVTIKNFKEVGVLLSKGIGKNFSLTGGVNSAFATVEFSPPQCPDCFPENTLYAHNPDFGMLSIPVYAEYALGKYFYAAAGPVVDFQLSEGNNFSGQSGVGFLVGLGGKLKTEKFAFSIFPNYKRHNTIPFEKEGNYKQLLQELGVQLGVGYRF